MGKWKQTGRRFKVPLFEVRLGNVSLKQSVSLQMLKCLEILFFTSFLITLYYYKSYRTGVSGLVVITLLRKWGVVGSIPLENELLFPLLIKRCDIRSVKVGI